MNGKVAVKKVTTKKADPAPNPAEETAATATPEAAAPAAEAPATAKKTAAPKTVKEPKAPKEPKEKGKPGPKGRRYDPKDVEKASWLSMLPPTELPDLTKGEKLMSKMLHEELGCEMVLHSDNTPRYFRLKGGDCRSLHIHGTPHGVSLCFRDKKVWAGKPEDLVDAIKAHIKENPAPVRVPPTPPAKKEKAPKAEAPAKLTAKAPVKTKKAEAAAPSAE